MATIPAPVGSRLRHAMATTSRCCCTSGAPRCGIRASPVAQVRLVPLRSATTVYRLSPPRDPPVRFRIIFDNQGSAALDQHQRQQQPRQEGEGARGEPGAQNSPEVVQQVQQGQQAQSHHPSQELQQNPSVPSVPSVPAQEIHQGPAGAPQAAQITQTGAPAATEAHPATPQSIPVTVTRAAPSPVARATSSPWDTPQQAAKKNGAANGPLPPFASEIAEVQQSPKTQQSQQPQQPQQQFQQSQPPLQSQQPLQPQQPQQSQQPLQPQQPQKSQQPLQSQQQSQQQPQQLKKEGTEAPEEEHQEQAQGPAPAFAQSSAPRISARRSTDLLGPWFPEDRSLVQMLHTIDSLFEDMLTPAWPLVYRQQAQAPPAQAPTAQAPQGLAQQAKVAQAPATQAPATQGQAPAAAALAVEAPAAAPSPAPAAAPAAAPVQGPLAEGYAVGMPVVALRRPWDVREEEGAYRMRFDLPGISREEVSVTVDDRNVLSISAQSQQGTEEGARSSHSFQTRVQLPKGIRRDEIAAGMKDGVLSVTVPKATAPKVVTVPVA